MPRLLLLAAVIFTLLYLTGAGRARLRTLSPQGKRRWGQSLWVVIPLLVAVALVLSGRLPALWAGAVALWPALLRALWRLLLLSPALRGFLGRAARGGFRSGPPPGDAPGGYRAGDRERSARARSGGSMDRAEALSVLGLQEGASPAEVEAAHRRLAGKVHPDLGGSDYLTAQINRARDVLLGRR